MISSKKNKENGRGIVLITGAARRIGRSMAIDLATFGWDVAIHYNSSQEDANQVAEQVRAHGCRAEIFQTNLEVEESCKQLIPLVNQVMGPINCLINNVSVFEPDTPETVTESSWNRHMQLNLRAPFVLMQEFAIQLTDETEGNIINIIDQRVWNLTPAFTSYTLSKAGLWALTQTLAKGLAPRIRVNAIGPGPTLQNVFQSAEDFEEEWKSVLLARKVDLGEICKAVRFILGVRSMTGQMLALDSGQHLGWKSSKNGVSDANC